jgi:hypothetical protein
MSEITALRTEIKAWERSFKVTNGRGPSVQDIRDQPQIGTLCMHSHRHMAFISAPSPAEKYKLYKRLSKASAVAAVFSGLSQSNDAPSTPPRSQPDARSSAILSNKRTIEPAGPLSTFNPFSPAKNKGKQKDISRSLVPKEGSCANPFVTPVSKRVEKRESSSDLFPAIQPLRGRPANTALSRARKRLRGEPVSPSPVKEKRPRVNSQASFPLPRLDGHQTSIDEGDDDDAANSSFVDDSPVKQPAGSKQFKLLFNEVVPQNVALTKNGGRLPQSRTTSLSTGLFGESSQKKSNSMSLLRSKDSVELDLDKDKNKQRKKGTSEKPTSGLPLRNPSNESSAEEEFPQATIVASSHDIGRRAASKRSISETETLPTDAPNGIVSMKHLPLLPPSPPPADSSNQSNSRYKGKITGKAMSRKKAKIMEDPSEDEEEDNPEVHNVRLVERNQAARWFKQDDADINLDPTLFVPRRTGIDDASQPADPEHDGSELHVDLPNQLREVLAISAPKVQDIKKEQVVRKLLYGQRTTHYDPRRGGEIWEVGEGGEELLNDREAEDDWEAEPVPWEVGEL